MNQSRLESLVEVVLGTLIGLVVSLVAQRMVFPLFGWSPPMSANLAIAAIFTVISVARGYLMRRFFNAGLHRVAVAIARRLIRRETAQ